MRSKFGIEAFILKEEKKRFSIRFKMYIFVIITILSVAIGTSTITYNTGAHQIDRYFKQNTADNARNFASMVDGDFLRELRSAAASEEFQAIRNQAYDLRGIQALSHIQDRRR